MALYNILCHANQIICDNYNVPYPSGQSVYIEYYHNVMLLYNNISLLKPIHISA